VSDKLYPPAVLRMGKNPCYYLNRKVGGPRSWSAHTGILTPDSPASSLVTGLFRLPFDHTVQHKNPFHSRLLTAQIFRNEICVIFTRLLLWKAFRPDIQRVTLEMHPKKRT